MPPPWCRFPNLLYRGLPNPHCLPSRTARRLGSRRYSRFGNLRYKSMPPAERRQWQAVPVQQSPLRNSSLRTGIKGRDMTSMSEIAVQAENLHKSYVLGASAVGALRGVDLVVRHEDFVSLMGPSGCGKTTLLNLIGAIDLPS